MNARRGLLTLGSVALLLGSAGAQAADSKQVERGAYLVDVTGCNDCHTPMYGQREGKVPKNEWLIGDQVGWYGPWGTSYPSNLRQRMHDMSEAQWVRYARTLKTRPPMPWMSLNAMSDDDLRALYQFIRSLGDSDSAVPAGLPPGQKPATPYLDVHVVMPQQKPAATP